MQVACPGCPTDTFTETLNTQTKLGSWKGKGARSGLARGAGVDGGKMMEWGRRAPKKKSLEQRSDGGHLIHLPTCMYLSTSCVQRADYCLQVVQATDCPVLLTLI